MVSDFVMTERHCLGRARVDDGIGLAAYPIDSHHVRRIVKDGRAVNEGNVIRFGFPSYPISYRALTPKRAEVTNLLVPVALSATHIAYGSIRMEPVFMVLGQAVAVAASQAIDRGVPVQGVDVPALQRELERNPLADGSVPEVLVDDRFRDRLRVTGRWEPAELSGRYGLSVLRSAGRDSGSVRFLPSIQTAGSYGVYIYWPAADGLAANVPIEIRHAGGTERRVLSQRRGEEGVQHGIVSWVSLGEYRFEPGREAWVEVGTAGANGAVLADAVLWVPVR
jgi:hypothetical protein